MYREIAVRAYGEEAINRIDQLRYAGVDITDLVLSAVMLGNVEDILIAQQEKRLACV